MSLGAIIVNEPETIVLVNPYSAVPVGPAGGDLAGFYPNPTIRDGAVVLADLADGTVTNVKVAAGAAIARSKLDFGAGLVDADIAAGAAIAASKLAPLSPLLLASTAIGQIPLTVRAFAGQTGDLQQWQNSTPALLAAIDAKGRLGINGGAASTTLASFGVAAAHPNTTTSVFGAVVDFLTPATATSQLVSLLTRARTTATAFTVTSGYGLFVDTPTIGAGSAVTTLYGIRVFNQGNAANNSAYGLWIDTQSGAITNNLPIVIGSTSTFSVQSTGQVTIGGAPTSALIGVSSAAHPSTAVNVQGIDVQYTVPSTATTTAYGLRAFSRLAGGSTLGTIASVRVDVPVPSTATVVSSNGIMVTNQGFANATNAYGLFIFSQSGASGDNLPIVINSASTFSINSSGGMTVGGVNNTARILLSTGNHYSTGTTIYGVDMEYVTPATATTSDFRFYGQTRTLAAAFTLASAAVFRADIPVIGAGSAVSTNRGLVVANQGNPGIVDAYGIQVSATSTASGLNVTGRIDTGSTCALWLGGDAAGTSVTGGIAFGSTRDVALYRGSSTTLETNAAIVTTRTAAPADADLGASEMAIWFDPTNGASKLMVKAKQADGTVKTASLALA